MLGQDKSQLEPENGWKLRQECLKTISIANNKPKVLINFLQEVMSTLSTGQQSI